MIQFAHSDPKPLRGGNKLSNEPVDDESSTNHSARPSVSGRTVPC